MLLDIVLMANGMTTDVYLFLRGILRKINYEDAEHAPESRLVTPNT